MTGSHSLAKLRVDGERDLYEEGNLRMHRWRSVFSASRFTLISLLVALIAVGFSSTDSAQEGKESGEAKLRGAYGFLATGNGGIPFAAVGLFRAKGNGTFDGQAVDNFSGDVFADTFRGSLTLAGDGTGTLMGMSSLGQRFTKSFVVTDGGEQIKFESTDTGEVEIIAARRQSSQSSFSLRDLRGNWGFECDGSESQRETSETVLVTAIGRLSNDGTGKFAGHGTYNNNGSVIEASFAGTSTVNSDGTFTDSGNYTSGLHGVFDDAGAIEDGTQLVTISTSSNGPVTCTLSRLVR
ncbi:MAG: hypothetical protein ACLQAT_28130 [Candidatus Binataceae bacterium]